MPAEREQPQYDVLDVSHIRFDPKNPRLPPWVDGDDVDQVLAWMLEDATLLQLMGSIGAQGYFPGEPILVVPVTGHPHQYTVVEGNRRVAALKLLLGPHSAPLRRKAIEEVAASAKFKPRQIPAAVFQRRDSILEYLGYRHVTGVKEWGSLEKTRYVQQLLGHREPKPATLTEIARKIGSRRDYIARLLAAAGVYDHVIDKHFYHLHGVDEKAFEFSLLYTATSYESIYRFIGMRSSDQVPPRLTDARVRELISWIYAKNEHGETVIGESRRLGDLATVLANDRAIRELRKTGDLDHAARYTAQPLVSFRATMEDSVASAGTALALIAEVPETEAEDEGRATNLLQLSNNLATQVARRLQKDK